MAEQFDVICTSYPDRDAWLKGRIGIGASEIGCVLGSGFKSAIDLWKEKTGKTKPKDLSANPAVELGNRMEDAIRNLYAAQHPEPHEQKEVIADLLLEGKTAFDGNIVPAQRALLQLHGAEIRSFFCHGCQCCRLSRRIVGIAYGSLIC